MNGTIHQGGSRKVCPNERSSVEVSPAKVGVAEVSSPEVGSAKGGSAEICSTKFGLCDVPLFNRAVQCFVIFVVEFLVMPTGTSKLHLVLKCECPKSSVLAR